MLKANGEVELLKVTPLHCTSLRKFSESPVASSELSTLFLVFEFHFAVCWSQFDHHLLCGLRNGHVLMLKPDLTKKQEWLPPEGVANCEG